MAIANAVCEAYDKNLGEQTALTSPKLKEAQAIDKLSKALGGKLLHFYVYAAVEGEALVFYFSHPAILMEFKSQKEVILEEMKAIWKREGIKKETVLFKRIEAKVKPKALPRQETAVPYEDKATGEFEIHCSDSGLSKIFERIRNNIKEGHDANR